MKIVKLASEFTEVNMTADEITPVVMAAHRVNMSPHEWTWTEEEQHGISRNGERSNDNNHDPTLHRPPAPLRQFVTTKQEGVLRRNQNAVAGSVWRKRRF